jgi:hypothetical protein
MPLAVLLIPPATLPLPVAVLFTPLREAPTATLQLLLLPAQVAARFHSPRAWIRDGLARFLQVKSVEERSGRRFILPSYGF